METLMAIIIGILFTIGVYLVLSKSLLRIIFGTSVIAHGTHLLIITMGGLKTGGPPLLDGRAVSYTDPLPQALILTAIVINFATTAFLLVLAYRAYSALGTENMDHLRVSMIMNNLVAFPYSYRCWPDLLWRFIEKAFPFRDGSAFFLFSDLYYFILFNSAGLY